MSLQEFIQNAKENIESHLSDERPNIAVVSHYPTYRKHYGNLISKLKEKYNVITIVGKELGDEFEKSGHYNVLFPFRVVENEQIYYINVDISGIDLIITADQVGYENGIIDREFLSKKAKRIYIPHSLIEQTGATEAVDYILVPSKLALESFEKILKNSNVKLLKSGYPKLDCAISSYVYKPSNTITYAPSLRYGDGSYATLNLLAGFENSIIEFLLDNTSYNINFRAHPMNFQNNHAFYQLIKDKWKSEARVRFDETLGNEFHNFSEFLITDISTSAFTYSLSTLRPSIFFTPLNTQNTIVKYATAICGGGGDMSQLSRIKKAA